MSRAKSSKSRLRGLLGWLAAVLLALALGLALRTWGAQAVRVAGTSMEPTLRDGELVLATRFDYLNADPARGDVVLCRLPGRAGSYVKRVIGLPGETVQIRAGATYIDGVLLEEPYAAPADKDFATALGADEYLVMGDNRPDSYDSREEDIGSLASGDFLGRVRLIIWPPERFGTGGGLRK